MYRHGMLITGTLLLAVAISSAGGDAAKAELKKLEGVWQPVSGESQGKATERFNRNKIMFNGDVFSVLDGDKLLFKATVKLDTTKTPKAIDMTISEGEETGKTALGIYALDGEQLKLCFEAPGGANRPTEFATKEGEKRIVVVSKREK